MNTKRRMGWLGMAALALLLATGSAQAQLAKSGKFSVTATGHWRGQAFESGENRWFATGVSYFVVLNSTGGGFLHSVSMICPWADDINQGKEASLGSCTATDGDGDKVYMEWRGAKAKPGDDLAGETEFTGGTGKYKGVTGKSSWKNKGVAVRNNGTEGEAIGYWGGEYRLP